MQDIFMIVSSWFLGLGKNYGVNPIIFGAIYVGAIPLFTLSVAWLVRNYRRNKSIAFPALAAASCFISAYVYLIFAGENIPWWVYAVVGAMLVYGVFSTYQKITRRIEVSDT